MLETLHQSLSAQAQLQLRASDDPYPPRMCRKKASLRYPPPSPVEIGFRDAAASSVAVRMARLHRGGVAASGGARRDGATATRRQHSYVGRRGEGRHSC